MGIATGIIAGGSDGGSTPGPGPPTPGPGSSSCWAGGRLCCFREGTSRSRECRGQPSSTSDKRIFMMSPLKPRRLPTGPSRPRGEAASLTCEWSGCELLGVRRLTWTGWPRATYDPPSLAAMIRPAAACTRAAAAGCLRVFLGVAYHESLAKPAPPRYEPQLAQIDDISSFPRSAWERTVLRRSASRRSVPLLTCPAACAFADELRRQPRRRRRRPQRRRPNRPLSADLRYRIDAFGHELAGQGSYQQLGQGPEKLLKLELKIQVADQAVIRQEICGPTFYYIRRESPLAPAVAGPRQPAAGAPGDRPRSGSRSPPIPAKSGFCSAGCPSCSSRCTSNFDFADAAATTSCNSRPKAARASSGCR